MEKQQSIHNKAFIVIASIILCLFAVYLIIDAKQASQAIVKSINSCLTIVIPSLYAFLVVSNLLVKSNLYIVLSKPFYPISKYLFRIPPELFSIFILSNIGGYPVGAKLLSELIRENKIDNQTAEKMMCYCYCNSPAFFAGAIGITVFNNVKAGLIAYFSVVLSNVIIAIIIGLKNPLPKNTYTKSKVSINAQTFIDSINSGFKTMSLICVMLVFFASIISFLDNSGITYFISSKIALLTHDTQIAKVSLYSIFEISQISQMAKYCYRFLPLISSIASLGGMCVLLQVTGITANTLSLKKFWISRPFCIALSGISCFFLKQIFFKSIDIKTSTPFITQSKEISIIPSICLILMSIILLIKKDRFSFKDML